MKLITTLLRPVFTNAKFYTNFAYTILVPVRVLLVTWCVLINESCKQSNFCVLGTFSDFSASNLGTNLLLVQYYSAISCYSL